MLSSSFCDAASAEGFHFISFPFNWIILWPHSLVLSYSIVASGICCSNSLLFTFAIITAGINNVVCFVVVIIKKLGKIHNIVV